MHHSRPDGFPASGHLEGRGNQSNDQRRRPGRFERGSPHAFGNKKASPLSSTVRGHNRASYLTPSLPESSLFVTILRHRIWLPDARGMLLWYGILLIAFGGLLVPLKVTWPFLSNLWAFMLVPPFVGALFYTRGTYLLMLAQFHLASVLLVTAFDMLRTGSGPGGIQEGIYTATIYIAAVGIGCEVTYRLTQARRRAERRYRILFERSVAGVFHATPEGLLLDCNAAFAMLLGAKNARDVMGPFGGALRGSYTGTQEWDSLLVSLREHGTIANRERALQRPDGTVLWLLETLTLLPADVSVGIDLGVGVVHATQGTHAVIVDKRPGRRQLGRAVGTSSIRGVESPWVTAEPGPGPGPGYGHGQLVEGTVIDITERKLAEEALKRQARTDALTGALNRGEMDTVLAQGIADAERSGELLSLILFDIDHFKRVNDDYGHDTGDDVLRGVVSTVAGVLRDGDRLARYGGEEFAIMLPGTSGESAVAVAERLRLAVASRIFYARNVGAAGPLHEQARSSFQVTVSVGVSQWRGNGIAMTFQTDGADVGTSGTGNGDLVGWGDTLETLVKRADRALYRAKAAGRNQVQLWQTGPLGASPADIINSNS